MKKVLIGLFPFFAFGQKYLVTQVPVTKNGDTLGNAWTGGMNAPVFSTIDWNGDGVLDLVAYDKAGWYPIPFLNSGSTKQMPYIYAPRYRNYFPKNMRHWLVMRDFDGDGMADIFALDANQGIGCYKGKRHANNEWTFTKYVNQLRYTDGNFWDRIWTFSDDLPGMVDVNKDGDMDILSFGIGGGTNIEYYENQSVEKGYGKDSLTYIPADLCWGRFLENAVNNSITLGACKRGELGSPTENFGTRHMGGTLFTFDYENDHDVDLLLGDISYNHLLFTRNDGDTSFAQVLYYDSLFPIYDTTINLPIFPAAYDVDADNDGHNDLLIAPFDATNLGLARDVRNVWFYKHQNLQGINKFHKVSEDFLSSTQLDFGTEAKPVFFDYNGDGKLDIIVGNYGYHQPYTQVKSMLGVYENNGSDTMPAFTLAGLDWANISTYNFVSVKPTFGDLDGDGLRDMVIGESTGKLHFFKNVGGALAQFPSITTPNYFGIDVGEFASPALYDVNGDSLLDLVVGEKNGKLYYYWNHGTRNYPKFSSDSANLSFGHINFRDNANGFPFGYANPTLVREGNQTMLYCGMLKGLVYKYILNLDSIRRGSFLCIDSNVIGENVGFRSHIAVADLNQDGWQDYLVGNIRGGLQLYSDSVGRWGLYQRAITNGVHESGTENGKLLLYPNPTSNILRVRLLGENNALRAIEIFDLLGRTVLIEQYTGEIHETTIRTNILPVGIYCLRARGSGGALLEQRFLVEKQ